MKFLSNLFRMSDEPGEEAAESNAAPTIAAAGGIDEYEEDASFSWLGADSVSSTLFDAPANGPAHDAEGRPQRASRRVSLALDGEDPQDDGYNPYDTGALDRR